MFAPIQTSSLSEMVTSIRSNGSLIVIRTHPGSASLVGRFVDMSFTGHILGSIAGDDTVFIAPSSLRETNSLMKQIEKAIREG
jgi:transcriptional regulator of arginine metabolism